MKFKQNQKIALAIKMDYTPLVDVIFQLIIFITLSSTFVMQPGIKVNLPQAVTSEAQLEKDIVVSITKEGKIFLMEKRVTLREFPYQLRKVIENIKKEVLIIKADKIVPHGLVVEIMDLAKTVGITKLAIATQPKELR